MSEKINFPTKLEEKLSFFDRLRKLMKRTSVAVDSNGKVSYISYPPRNGFTDKQKKNIETLEVNDVLILGDDRDRALLELENLKTLVLGRGVIAVAEGAVPTTGLEELVISDQAKQIPVGAISRTSIKRVRGNGFDISTTSKNTQTDIFFDQDERIHFLESASFSFGQLDNMDGRGVDSVLEAEAAARSLSKQILKSSSQRENKNSIYVYSETLGRDRVYSVHAVADTFPMPSNRGEKIDDDKLIGIYLTGVEDIDLSTLAQYPNLTQIVVGKDVKRITGTVDTKENGIVEDKIPQRTQMSKSGKEQTITVMSGDTIVLNPVKQTQTVHQRENEQVKDAQEREDD
ncbi:MAG: hypothetical protein IKL55_01935 [Clostridia bacterium]|nr:hypothetical protein [Clostridia bacterium]